MRWFTIFCAVVLMAASAPVAAADYAKPCFSAKSNPKSAFAACSHLIASGRFKGRNLANVYDWRSLAAYRSHNWSSAIANINRALRLGSTNRSNLLFRRATAFAATGNLEEALESAEQSTHANSRSTDAYLVLAQVLARMRDYDRAISAADRALALNPNSAVAYNERGFLHHMRKEYDLALADYDDAIRLDPKLGVAWSNRSNTWDEKGDLDRAIADADRSIALSPTIAALYCIRAGHYRAKGNYDKALHDLDECQRLDPAIPNPHIGRGLILRARGDLDGAIAEYAKAIKLNPNLPAAFAGRGLAYEAQGNPGAAMRDYQKTLSLASGAFIGMGTTKSTSIEIDVFADRFKQIARARLAVLADAGKTTATPSTAINASVNSTTDHDQAVRRIALVIGNGAYVEATALSNPPHDARLIAEQLREMGFAVTEGIDLDRAGMRQKVNEFMRNAVTAQLALVFYAGHGMQIGGKNYLIPVDTRIDAPGSLSAQLIDLDTILAGLDNQIRTNIIILDACRNDPFAKVAQGAGASRSFSVRAGLAAPTDVGRGAVSGAGTLIAFATAPGQVAYDGEGADSPFSAALGRHISTPRLEVQQMLTRVRADVVAITKGKQVPWSNSSLLGEVYLAPSP